ncbi:MAG: acetolactate synthase large subunit [Syntrophales bacterium]|jgi:acetolactate synthase I/II/III large subunit
MTGAEIILNTAAGAGVEICFANPGTTELPLVAALDTVKSIRPVLGLFEGVCTGAADGYARMKQKPTLTLLHLGPGFANGIANLHNAKRAQSPILNIIGQHAAWHLNADPPLNMDIASLARTVSGWYKQSESVEALSHDTAEGLAASLYGEISTLIVPADHQWTEYESDIITLPEFAFDKADQGAIANARKLLKEAKKPALILGGRALRKPGLAAAAEIRAKTDCDLLMITFPAYFESGEGLPILERIPYFPGQARTLLGNYDTLILAGANEPVAFFGYPDGKSSLLSDQQRRFRIDTEKQDVAAILEELARTLDAVAGKINPMLAKYALPGLPSGKLDADKMCATIAALQPEHCIIVDEGISSTAPYYSYSPFLKPYSQLNLTGGAIGQGMPLALGAALACPDRKVINIEADGSAMYTIQALWSQAREKADVITVICSNRKYFIIELECMIAGYSSLGAEARAMMNLTNPALDWVGLSRGMGVPAASVTTAEELIREFKAALKESGPHLIEVILE